MEKIKARQKAYVESVGERTKAPRYLQGPTVIGLKIVVQAMQEMGEPMHGHDIFNYIHNNGLGKEFRIPPARPLPSNMGRGSLFKSQPPEPSHPEHPVRSHRYMKTVLLNELEVHGRVRKVHIETDIDPANPPDPNRTHIKGNKIHEWRWELVAPNDGQIPWEEQENIEMRKADRLWLESMKRLQGNQDSAEMFATSIGGSQTQEPGFAHTSKSGTANGELFGWEGGEDLTKRTRKILGTDSEQVADLRYGNRLAARWREITTRGPNFPRRGEAKGDSRSYWKDPDESQRREEHRMMFNTKPFMLNYNPELFKDGARPGFNKDEPAYRQSRQGKNDIPIALRDPRARLSGFNYGLPKQKRLLAAANARGYDQPEWTDQPPRDITHLSRRRQRTRQKQTQEMAKEFVAQDRYERRMAAQAARLPTKKSATLEESAT